MRSDKNQPTRAPAIPRTTDVPILNEIVRRLVDAVHPDAIFLFGSRARGEATGESDYDILLLVNEPSEAHYSVARRSYAAMLGLGVPVDIVVMDRAHFEQRSRAASSLPAIVEREGRLLYAA